MLAVARGQAAAPATRSARAQAASQQVWELAQQLEARGPAAPAPVPAPLPPAPDAPCPAPPPAAAAAPASAAEAAAAPEPPPAPPTLEQLMAPVEELMGGALVHKRWGTARHCKQEGGALCTGLV